MGFQTTINVTYAFGVIGEILNDGPTRAATRVVNSSGAANVVGYAYTRNNQTDICAVGGTIASGTVFGGILVMPKSYASYGTTAGTLVPTLNVPDNTNAEFLEMGTIVVALATACNIGDLVVYDTTTGALSTVAAGSGSAGTGKAFVPNALVRTYNAAAGIAAIRLTN